MSIKRFTDVGTDTGAGTNKLIGQDGFPFCRFDFIADFDNFQSKGLGFGKEWAVSHVITCFKYKIQFFELNFSTLRNSLLSFVSGLENGLGFVLGNVAVKGEKANVTYYVQDGAIVSIDGQQQKPVSGTTYQYKMDLAKDTYIHVTVENASGKSVVYNQFVSKPVYVLSALSDAADLDGITVTEGSQAEFVTNDMYSVDGTAVHLKVNGVVTGDILEDATFKPSVTIDTAMFTESIADYATVQISMYNPGEAFTVAIKTRSGSSNAALGDYEIPTGMTTLELDLANQIANFETIDAIVLEFNNVADEAPLSYEFYMDNIVGDK